MRPQYDERRGDVATLRVIWAALLLAQAAVGAVVFVLAPAEPADPRLANLLRAVAVGMLVTLTPLAMFVRNQVYKAHWSGNAIAPRGYVRGNLLLLALLDAVAVTALVMMAVAGRDWLLLGVAGAAVAVQAVNYPTGKPMRPVEPVFEEPDRP